jgi:predicted PurR-regulated permease PerM
LVLVIACLYWAKAVLIPIALAILITFLLNPVVSALHGRGLPRIAAILVVVVLLFSVVGGVAWTVTRQLSSLAYELPRYQENLKQKSADLRELGKNGVVERVMKALKEITDELQRSPQPASGPRVRGTLETAPDEAGEKPVPVVVQNPSVLWQLPSLLESLATAGLVLVLVIFMLIRYADLRARLLYLAGHHRLTIATKALDEAGQRISRYLLMQSIINGSFGAAAGIGFFLIGVPYAVLWGFLAGALRFIPYAGPTIAAALPSALSLAVFPGWGPPLLVISLILALELASNLILEPLLYGQSAGVSEVALLVAVTFWTWLWGGVGLILATPMTVCIGVLAKYVPQLNFIGVLLGDEPVMGVPTNYYQRLVAHDQDEAAELVDDYLESHPLEALYDEVLIPALSAAKQDHKLGTLTDDDMQFIINETRAIVEDLGLRLPQVPTSDATPPQALGCPAYDATDELALQMLQQLLDPTRYRITIVSAHMLASEMLSVVEEQHVQLICVAALPPGPLAPVRYLCKRLRARFRDCWIVVGRWGAGAEAETLRARLRDLGADEVGATLRETRNQLMQLSQIIPPAAASSTPPSETRR